MPLMVIMIEKMWRVDPLIHIMKHSMATCGCWAKDGGRGGMGASDSSVPVATAHPQHEAQHATCAGFKSARQGC